MNEKALLFPTTRHDRDTQRLSTLIYIHLGHPEGLTSSTYTKKLPKNSRLGHVLKPKANWGKGPPTLRKYLKGYGSYVDLCLGGWEEMRRGEVETMPPMIISWLGRKNASWDGWNSASHDHLLTLWAGHMYEECSRDAYQVFVVTLVSIYWYS